MGFTNVSRLAGGIIAYDRTLNEKKEGEESMLHRAGSIQMPEHDIFGKPFDLAVDQLNQKDVHFQMKQNCLPELEEQLAEEAQEKEPPKQFKVTKNMVRGIKFRAEQGKDHNGEFL